MMGRFDYTRVGGVTINGVDLDVTVNEDGTFALDTQGDDPQTLGSGDSLEKAKAAARVKMAKDKVEVAVPFIVIASERFGGGLRYRKGTARGIHGGSGDVLVTYEDGRKGKLAYNATVFAADTDEATITEFIRQRAIATEASRAARTIEREHEMHLKSAVSEAMTEKAHAVAAA